MFIFAANRNENNYIDSFTVCSDSDNNSTDKLKSIDLCKQYFISSNA